MSSINRCSRASAIAGIGLVATLGISACSSGTTSSGKPGSTAGSGSAVGAPGQPAGGEQGAPAVGAPGAEAANGDKAAAPGAAKDGSAAQAPDVSPAADAQKLVRTARVRLSVDDVTAGAAGVRAIALGVGGVVTAEDVSTTQPGPDVVPPTRTTSDPIGTPSVPRRQDTGTVTIAVPAAELDTVLDQLGKLGAVVQRTSNSQDVTTTYVDTQSRIGTMKTSIDRLRTLMTQTTAIEQIVRLEMELSQREANLESLQAKLATLDKQVTMSTIVVTLTSTATTSTPAPEETGFLAGVRSGWKAFTGFSAGLFTVVGAVLPFVATIVLLALPALIWWRRRAPKAASRGRAFASFEHGDPEAEPDNPDEKQRQTVSTRKAESGGATSPTQHGGASEGRASEGRASSGRASSGGALSEEPAAAPSSTPHP